MNEWFNFSSLFDYDIYIFSSYKHEFIDLKKYCTVININIFFNNRLSTKPVYNQNVHIDSYFVK